MGEGLISGGATEGKPKGGRVKNTARRVRW